MACLEKDMPYIFFKICNYSAASSLEETSTNSLSAFAGAIVSALASKISVLQELGKIK